MYAIVEICGKQYRVAEGATITVDRMASKAVGDEITLDKVLMIGGSSVKIGSPLVDGAKATATVVDHVRGEKVRVFKKWRRNDSRKMRGFRHDYTTLKISAVSA